jgi:hypothetical protein
MHEFCRCMFSKSVTYAKSLSKPEKPNDRNSMYELCRFADLIPTPPDQIDDFSIRWNKIERYMTIEVFAPLLKGINTDY